MRPLVIAVVGPTGSGKSAVAQRVAELLDGEIISADSMQIYRELNVGTAKVPPQNRSVPYHCIDMISISESYSAARYQHDAREAIESIAQRGRVPMLCGGTGFYVRAALDEMDFAPGEQEDNPVRAAYEELFEREGQDALYQLLLERDPAAQDCVHPHNVKRVIRALEVIDSGELYSQRTARLAQKKSYYPTLMCGLNYPRPELYKRLDERVDGMVDAGLADEVRRLRAAGLSETLTASAAIGYKEFNDYFEGLCSLEEALDTIKQNTRRYAKRQLSWFRGDERVKWFERTGDQDVETTALQIVHSYHEKEKA